MSFFTWWRSLFAQNVAETVHGEVTTCTASSFADPKDVAAFQRCKAQGKTDQECFRVGDNGLGFEISIGNGKHERLNCADPDKCYCALPPEIWRPKWGTPQNAARRRVIVSYVHRATGATTTVTGLLGDTMPHLANITNGARIDLNPGFAKALGLNPPFMATVSWSWGE